jgi:hypothetical protein
MIMLHARDDDNHLLLTAYWLPRYAIYGSPADSQEHNGASKWNRLPLDEGTAHILNAVANQVAAFRLERSGRPMPPGEVGLQTVLLGPNPEGAGRLHAWFADQPSSTRCRVALHRTPRRYESCSLPLLWDEVYDEVDANGPKRVAVEPDTLEAYDAALCVLTEGLTAYRAGPPAVHAFIEGLGHPYVHVE